MLEKQKCIYVSTHKNTTHIHKYTFIHKCVNQITFLVVPTCYNVEYEKNVALENLNKFILI